MYNPIKSNGISMVHQGQRQAFPRRGQKFKELGLKILAKWRILMKMMNDLHANYQINDHFNHQQQPTISVIIDSRKKK